MITNSATVGFIENRVESSVSEYSQSGQRSEFIKDAEPSSSSCLDPIILVFNRSQTKNIFTATSSQKGNISASPIPMEGKRKKKNGSFHVETRKLIQQHIVNDSMDGISQREVVYSCPTDSIQKPSQNILTNVSKPDLDVGYKLIEKNQVPEKGEFICLCQEIIESIKHVKKEGGYPQTIDKNSLKENHFGLNLRLIEEESVKRGISTEKHITFLREIIDEHIAEVENEIEFDDYIEKQIIIIKIWSYYFNKIYDIDFVGSSFQTTDNSDNSYLSQNGNDFRCHHYALYKIGINLSYIGRLGSEEEFKLFTETGNVLRDLDLEITTTPSPGDLVVYSRPGQWMTAAHFGVYRTPGSKNNSFLDGRVISKWGPGCIWDHEISSVLSSYGTHLKFYKKKIKTDYQLTILDRLSSISMEPSAVLPGNFSFSRLSSHEIRLKDSSNFLKKAIETIKNTAFESICFGSIYNESFHQELRWNILRELEGNIQNLQFFSREKLMEKIRNTVVRVGCETLPKFEMLSV